MLIRLLRRFGPVMGMTMTSQAINAASLLLIPFTLTVAWSDIYSVSIQVGSSALGGVVIGVVYNIAIGRRGFNRWRTAAAAASIFSIGLGIVAGILVYSGGGAVSTLGLQGLLLLGTFTIGGIGLAVGGCGAVRAACHGNALPLASVNLLPATALLLSLLCVLLFGAPMLLPGICWALVALAQAAWFWRGSYEYPTTAEGESARSQLSHIGALSLGVIASTVLPTFYIAAITQLPGGVTSVVFLITRIATSIVGLGVNSVLLVRYSWNSPARNVQPLTRPLVALAAAGLVIGLALSAIESEVGTLVCMVISWIAMLVASAVILRETNSRKLVKAIAVKVGVDLSLSSLGAVWLFTNPSVQGYFGVFTLSQAVTTLVCGIYLRYRWTAILSALVLVLSVANIVLG
ncbi:hypothetical protein [Herbiconiux ginsengi]|nr:hypothetical protein [Herbiconiux ginsengi]